MLPSEYISEEVFLPWAHQIAAGLEFLHSHKIVHGDLALRNILIGPLSARQVTDFMDGATDPPCDLDLKLADFGLSHALEGTHQTLDAELWCSLEFRSSSPELLALQKIQLNSDVWTFGIVAWQIMTLVGEPFVSVSNSAELLTLLEQGERLPIDDIHMCFEISPKTKQLLADTWNFSPLDRPSSQQVVARLEPDGAGGQTNAKKSDWASFAPHV